LLQTVVLTNIELITKMLSRLQKAPLVFSDFVLYITIMALAPRDQGLAVYQIYCTTAHAGQDKISDSIEKEIIQETALISYARTLET
jgi:hypothetical protein